MRKIQQNLESRIKCGKYGQMWKIWPNVENTAECGKYGKCGKYGLKENMAAVSVNNRKMVINNGNVYDS